jgi:hypothetical protein
MEGSTLTSLMHDVLWIYPTMLTLHAVGLAFAAGMSVAIDLRVLGAAAALPLPPMRRLLPVIYAALAVNACSGVALVFNNPAHTLGDWLFYVKLMFLLLAVVTLEALKRPAFTPALGADVAARGKLLAAASLFLWTATIVSGRLLEYTFFR